MFICAWKRLGSSPEFLGNGGNVLPLVESLLQFKLRRVSRTITSVSSSSIRTSAFYLLHFKHASTKCVPNGHEDQPVVNKLGDSSQSAIKQMIDRMNDLTLTIADSEQRKIWIMSWFEIRNINTT